MIKNNIENLKQNDFYSAMLFALYKMNEIPEYSSLSQLAYVFDQKNLLNLCEYFGGQTIKIPTISEMESLVCSLLLYQYVKIDNMKYEDALELIEYKSQCELKNIRKKYNSLCKILEEYSFTPQESL